MSSLGVAPAGADEAQQQSVLAPLAPRSLLLDIARSGERLVTVGARGHVLLSDDGGRSWHQVVVPTRSTLTAVTFADESTAVAVGHDAVILRSADSGESWELVHADPAEEAPLLDVHFADAANGIAAGAYGYLLTSSDGGRTWEPSAVNEDDDFHLNRIAPGPPGDLLLAAEAGLVYRSTDGGATWESLESPYEGSFFGALNAAPEELLVFGLRGNLYRSVDDGVSWEQVELPTDAMLNDAARLPDGRVAIVGLQGVILLGRGSDYNAWQLPSREGLAAVLALDDSTLVSAGEAGVRRLALDGLQPLQDVK